MSQSTRTGFILHYYNRSHKGLEHIYAIGCLDTGESFGIIVNNYRPRFYIAVSDLATAQTECSKIYGAQCRTCPMHSLDGKQLLEISANTHSALRRIQHLFSRAEIASYEAELATSKAWQIDHNIRGCIEITGIWSNGNTVDHII